MDLVLRAVFAFAFLLLITRVIGRRELASLEPFDLILLVVVGDLVQQGITQSDYSITGTVLVLCTMTMLTVLVSLLSFRVRWLRPLLDGKPIVLVERGRILDDSLRRQRLTYEELAAAARLQQVASLNDIEWAVLETNGQISVIPRSS